ncbi:MAG: hypothetical protein DRP75_00825 [Candidatus Omnitrophota bacterium]|nr:MAG: hypothetical protein DRP75_00825 [Candidatus Omnitrophota bacterium]
MEGRNLLHKLRVVSNLRVSPGYFKMVLFAPRIAQSAYPGQFIYLLVENTCFPLLRRAFSVHRVREEKGEIEILCKIRGEGTKLLSRKREGEEIEAIGPLGRGFECFSREDYQAVVLVGGGVGIAPLVFLGERIKNRKGMKVLVLIGAKRREEVLCVKDFQDLGYKVEVATEDGSQGRKALVSELLAEHLANAEVCAYNVVYSSGPLPMLKEVARISGEYRLSSYVCVEQKMGCGIGVCRGCAIGVIDKQGRRGYKRVCRDGPVFEGGEIDWTYV